MPANTKVIIYDDSCPLCIAYTNAFVTTGFIEKNCRQDFTNVPEDLLNMIDQDKCRNQIPLVDPQTKEIWYGIDALLEILGSKIPLIKQVGNIKPIKWLLHKLYKFISFNRRVIVAPTTSAKGFDCTPDFNLRYRILFMLVGLVFNTWMLVPLHHYVLSNSLFSADLQTLEAAHLAIVLINIAIAFVPGKRHSNEYLGQVNMLAMITLLATIPLMLFNKFTHVNSYFINMAYLTLTGCLFGLEYKRRMKFAGITRNFPIVKLLNAITIAAFILLLIYNKT